MNRFEVMWMYLLVFLAALIVDTIPVFAPPAWTVLVVLLLTFHLNPWLVVIIGVTGSTLGRYILSLYIAKISAALVNRREDKNLRYVGSKLAQTIVNGDIYISLHPDASLHHGAFHRGRHRARQPLAYFAAFFLQKIDYRRRDGLH
jgi:hypothetical protein